MMYLKSKNILTNWLSRKKGIKEGKKSMQNKGKKQKKRLSFIITWYNTE